MKIFFNRAKILLVLSMTIFMLSSCSSTKKIQSESGKSSSALVKNMVDSQKFVFVAESVNPLHGRYRNLTSSYDVSVFKDSLVSYLPYFGRAYTAPINPSEGGINFTSSNFSYDVIQTKSDKWDVTIKPHDVREIQQLNFTIFDNGSASLIVTSSSKDPISFSGHLK